MSAPLWIDRAPLGAGWVEYWTLNAPGSRNALTDAMVNALRDACTRATGDATLRAIVLQGAGGHFCAGGSLGDFASAIGRPFDGRAVDDPLVGVNRAYGALLQQLCALPQFVIAAVQGAAMGGGVGLVCCADHVLSAPDAVFATPEVTLGIVPAQIAPFVVRRLGDARARDWLLSGARWTAQQALAAGLVNALADNPTPSPAVGQGEAHALPVSAADAPLQAAVLQKLKHLTTVAPAAVAQTKQVLSDIAAAHPLDDLLASAALRFAQALRGREAPLGLKAFAARQPPPWAIGPESTE